MTTTEVRVYANNVTRKSVPVASVYKPAHFGPNAPVAPGDASKRSHFSRVFSDSSSLRRLSLPSQFVDVSTLVSSPRLYAGMPYNPRLLL